VFAAESTPIRPGMNAGELSAFLAELGAELLLRLLPGILSGELEPVPQDHRRKTLAPKLRKAEARIDWRKSAAALARQVWAFNPWPVAEAVSGHLRLRIHDARPLPGPVQATPGRIVAASADGIDVATGDGVLRLTQVQPSGGRPMDAAAYLNARDVSGLCFELPAA
jgi:methionyl-tRNA formyltransferase